MATDTDISKDLQNKMAKAVADTIQDTCAPYQSVMRQPLSAIYSIGAASAVYASVGFPLTALLFQMKRDGVSEKQMEKTVNAFREAVLKAVSEGISDGFREAKTLEKEAREEGYW